MNLQLGALMERPIAHRGLHDLASGVIENSLSAFDAAVAARYAIECDVQISADGEAMVFHDYVLDRLTAAEGRVDACAAEALQRHRLRQAAGGETIPTLRQMLDRVGGQVPIVIELKSRFDGDERLARRVGEVLAAYPDHPICVESFDPAMVVQLAQRVPDRPRGIVGMGTYEYPDFASVSEGRKREMAHLLHFEATKPDFLSWKVSDLQHAAPFLCRRALGIPVSAWTVRTPADRASAVAGADQIVFEGFRPD